MVEQHLFSSQNIIKHHIKSSFKEKQIQEKFKAFDENHGLNSLANANILVYVKMAVLQATKRLRKCLLFYCVKMTFVQATKPSFLATIPSKSISNHFCKKKVLRGNFFFLTKIVIQKSNFFDYVKMTFFSALFSIQKTIREHIQHFFCRESLSVEISTFLPKLCVNHFGKMQIFQPC